MAQELTGNFAGYFTQKFTKKSGETGEIGFVLLHVLGAYPKDVAFKVWKDDIKAKVQNLKHGSQLTVHYDLESRRWEKDGVTKFFTDATAWQIEGGEEQPQEPSQPSQPSRNPEPEEDDLPF